MKNFRLWLGLAALLGVVACTADVMQPERRAVPPSQVRGDTLIQTTAPVEPIDTTGRGPGLGGGGG